MLTHAGGVHTGGRGLPRLFGAREQQGLLRKGGSDALDASFEEEEGDDMVSLDASEDERRRRGGAGGVGRGAGRGGTSEAFGVEVVGGTGDEGGGDEEEGEWGEGGGGKGSKKAGKKKKKKRGSDIVDDIGDRDFGRRPEDLIDGGAFEERVGTYGPDRNAFALPKDFARKIRRGADPLTELRKLEEASERVREAARARRAAKRERKAEAAYVPPERGVMYLGHIPWAFEEEQQFQFLSQFGRVLRLRLAKSKRTGKNKGWGWVEWEDREIGKQVCDHLNGLAVFGKTLAAHMVDDDKVHPELFRNAGHRFKKVDWRLVELERQTRPKTPKQQKRCDSRRLRRNRRSEEKVMRRVGHLGWTFDEVNSEVKRREGGGGGAAQPATRPSAAVDDSLSDV